MLRKIIKAEPVSGTRLRLTYEGGDRIDVDFAPVIAKGGVFVPLADPAFFAQVSVERGGRALCWPGQIEFCADALWLHAQGQQACVA